MAEEIKKVEDIMRRFVWAEGQTIRDRPPQVKHKWQKTQCPKCKFEVKYEPIPGKWDGNIHCPHCGHDFKIPVLTDYVEEEK